MINSIKKHHIGVRIFLEYAVCGILLGSVWHIILEYMAYYFGDSIFFLSTIFNHFPLPCVE